MPTLLRFLAITQRVVESLNLIPQIQPFPASANFPVTTRQIMPYELIVTISVWKRAFSAAPLKVPTLVSDASVLVLGPRYFHTSPIYIYPQFYNIHYTTAALRVNDMAASQTKMAGRPLPLPAIPEELAGLAEVVSIWDSVNVFYRASRRDNAGMSSMFSRTI